MPPNVASGRLLPAEPGPAGRRSGLPRRRGRESSTNWKITFSPRWLGRGTELNVRAWNDSQSICFGSIKSTCSRSPLGLLLSDTLIVCLGPCEARSLTGIDPDGRLVTVFSWTDLGDRHASSVGLRPPGRSRPVDPGAFLPRRRRVARRGGAHTGVAAYAHVIGHTFPPTRDGRGWGSPGVGAAGRRRPGGGVGKGGEQECLRLIEEVWTDMRPLSLRRKMAEAGV